MQVNGTFGACDEPPEARNATASVKQTNTSKASSMEPFSELWVFEMVVVALSLLLYGL